MVFKSLLTFLEEQHVFTKALVCACRFPSVSAVLHQGFVFLLQQEVYAQADRAALRVLLQQRSKGAFISADQLRAKLAKQLR